MRRASPHLAPAFLAAVGVLTLAGAASAQSARESAEARGLRYLSWQGRGEAATPVRADPAPSVPARADRRPNPVIPHGGSGPAGATAPERPAPAPVRRTLTPANAWLRPTTPPPAYAPPPPPAAVAPPPPTPPTPTPTPTPEYLPDAAPRGQPAPAAVVYPAAVAPDARAAHVPADPMAPRRDAPIFHMQRDAPPPSAATPAAAPPDEAAAGDGPPRQGARYYSVHRQNGRQPDALVMPAPNYVDALVVSSIDTLASQDLAQPAQGPTLIRGTDGGLRAAPAASDGDHQ